MNKTTIMELTTKRLFLRPVCLDDKDTLFKYRSDPETFKYLSFIPNEVNDVEKFIKKSAKNINVPGTWFQFVILLKDSKILIGDIGVHFLDADPQSEQVEIGYTLNPMFRNNGYAIEALSEIIDYLFRSLNKHRITASIDPTNEASIKLIEKLGFRKEAHFKKSLFFHGKWVDDLVYAILSEEWRRKY
jgi:RimJ/RimL family protein N-acetyltransferase